MGCCTGIMDFLNLGTLSFILMYVDLINMMYLQHRKEMSLSEYWILCKLGQIMQMRNMQMS